MLLDSLWHNARISVRSWRRSPGFHGVLIRDAGARHRRLHRDLLPGQRSSAAAAAVSRARPAGLSQRNRLGRREDVGFVARLPDWRARQHSFEALALSRSESFTLTGAGPGAERLRGRRVTGNFFAVLAVPLQLGAGIQRCRRQSGSAGRSGRQPRLLAPAPRCRPRSRRSNPDARGPQPHDRRRRSLPASATSAGIPTCSCRWARWRTANTC